MSLAENRVVYFLTNAVKCSDIVFTVLGTPIALYCIISHIANVVELVKKIISYNVVCIQYDYIVIITFIVLNRILHSLSLRAFIKCWQQKVYWKSCKCFVCFR